MKKISIIISISLLGLLNCGKKEKSPAILVTFVKGNVTAISKNQSRKLKTGQLVFTNDKIITKKNSVVDLQFSSSVIMKIGQQSEVIITKNIENTTKISRNIELNLAKGSVFSKIHGKLRKNDSFQVRTPAAVAAVRGTEFETNVDDDNNTQVSVTKGKVAVKNSNGEEQVVEEGNKIDIDAVGKMKQSLLELIEKQRLKDKANIESIKKSGKENIEDILRKGQELKEAIISEAGVEDQKEKNRNLINDQKDKDRKMLDDQIRKDQQNKQDVINKTNQDKDDIKNKADADKGKILKKDNSSVNKSALDKLKKKKGSLLDSLEKTE